ncbi:MAG: tRNA sulfurtransferase [Candidatus Hadarchaeaceae archaeon]
MTKTVIVRYGEIALKSEPVRRRFERQLIENIRLTLKGLDYKLRRERGRIFTDTRRPSAVIGRLAKTPGIVSLSPSLRTNATIDSITSVVVREAKKVLSPGMTFAIRTSRVGDHSFSSRDVNVSAGSAVLAEMKGVRVNLSTPELKIFVDVRGRDAYVFTKIVDGVGGLPVGTQGSIVALFSESLNSSVSSYLMMKRGCMLYPIFFDPRPHADGRARKHAVGRARKLAGFYPKLELRIFPYGRIFHTVTKAAQGMENLLHKRAMIRAAEVIAGQVGGVAIVGDEDLEKIAEGGVETLGAVDDACELPVLRPLAGMVKKDIEKIANRIGIFGPSARAAKIYPPPYHSTALKVEEIREIEEGLNIDALIESALPRVKIIKLRRSAWT